MNIYQILMVIAAYLIGSIPVGYIVVKKKTGKDIRTFGSGVTGSTNVSRVCGRRWGIVTGIADFLKGFAPSSMAIFLWGVNWMVGLIGLLVVVGHNFPVFIGFKGGKGVATTGGFLVPILIAVGFAYRHLWVYGAYLGILAIWLAIMLGFKRMSAASIFLAASLVVFFGLLVVLTHSSFSPYLFLTIVATAALVLARHWENWKRLYKGKERTIESSWEK